jgi:hypothetical protein
VALPEKPPVQFTIVPPESEERRARAGYEELWRDLVAVKARCAEAINEVAVLRRAFEDLKTDTRRHIKRVDAIASRLTAPQKP